MICKRWKDEIFGMECFCILQLISYHAYHRYTHLILDTCLRQWNCSFHSWNKKKGGGTDAIVLPPFSSVVLIRNEWWRWRREKNSASRGNIYALLILSSYFFLNYDRDATSRPERRYISSSLRLWYVMTRKSIVLLSCVSIEHI